jgi:hypothetical protein
MSICKYVVGTTRSDCIDETLQSFLIFKGEDSLVVFKKPVGVVGNGIRRVEKVEVISTDIVFKVSKIGR